MENTYDDIEADMWGCFGWVAVFGLILLLLTFLLFVK